MADQRDQKKNQPETVGDVAISYRGLAGRAEAELLMTRLQSSGLAVDPLTAVGEGEPLLGASEVIITIVLAPIAQAAARAVISTTLNYLRDYFVERVESGDTNLDGQLVVGNSSVPGGNRFPFSLRRATAETIKAFFQNVQGSIAKS
jgi:hypothetical protein